MTRDKSQREATSSVDPATTSETCSQQGFGSVGFTETSLHLTETSLHRTETLLRRAVTSAQHPANLCSLLH